LTFYEIINHRKSEKLRRDRSKYKRVAEIIVKTCGCLSMMVKSLFIEGNERKTKGHCICCGCEGNIVDVFPRRSYGKKKLKEEYAALAI